MTDFTTTARPYASAVYKLAVESDTLENWSDILALMSLVSVNPEMVKLLNNPQLGKQLKGEAFIKVIDEKLNDLHKNLIKIMAENGRLAIIPDIVEQYEVFRADAEGKIDAEVISAFTLTQKQEKEIAQTLKNKMGREVSLTSRVDESLIGGVIVKAGDTVIDASMKSQLEMLSTSLSH